MDLCEELGVRFGPALLCSDGVRGNISNSEGGEVAVVPLYSWYKSSFGGGEPNSLSQMEKNFDMACLWPPGIGDPDQPRFSLSNGISEFMLKLNQPALADWKKQAERSDEVLACPSLCSSALQLREMWLERGRGVFAVAGACTDTKLSGCGSRTSLQLLVLQTCDCFGTRFLVVHLTNILAMCDVCQKQIYDAIGQWFWCICTLALAVQWTLQCFPPFDNDVRTAISTCLCFAFNPALCFSGASRHHVLALFAKAEVVLWKPQPSEGDGVPRARRAGGRVGVSGAHFWSFAFGHRQGCGGYSVHSGEYSLTAFTIVFVQEFTKEA